MNKILIVIALISVVACNAVKRVLKDKDKIEIVGREWEKTNGCTTDSFVSFISDTLIKIDTAYKYKLDTINSLQVIETVDTVFVNKVIRIKDTTKIRVTDLRRLNIALDSVSHYKGLTAYYKVQFNEQTAETKVQKNRGDKWKLYFWLLLIIPIVLFIVYKILKSKFTMPI
jgi:hypothetical protein